MTSLFGANGKMERLERVHLAKGTKIFAFGAYMCDQEFVIYDDEMNAVEICNGDPTDIDEPDLNMYFFPIHKVDEEVRPISKKFGIGFYYDESGELVPDDIIEKSLLRAKNLYDFKEKKEKEKAEADVRLAEKLKEEYSYLQQVGEGSRYKICGENMRMELKKKFPGTKFSVRYKSFSGGEEYFVTWVDGPTRDDVEEVINKYQDHHSDYSGDYWDYDPSVFNNLFGGVKYVMSQRDISKETLNIINEEYKDLTEENVFSYEFNEEDQKQATFIMSRGGYSRDEMISMIARGRSYVIPEQKKAPIEEVKAEGLEIVDYSEKAFAVIGNTKEIKEELKRIGGRFNARLTCGAGWIFSKSKLDEVKEFLNK